MGEKKDFKGLIAEIKDAYDLADYMASVGVVMKPAGVEKWKCCCPFHAEKTPSCVVNGNFQNYHCFGCGASGDLINFVMNFENMPFMEAVQKLAFDKGIAVETGFEDNGVDYRSLRKILELTKAYYIQCFNVLDDDHPARQQVLSRSLTVDNTSHVIKYGYSPEGNRLTKALRNKGFSDDMMVAAGVARTNSSGRVWDAFQGRLMFFLEDFNGRPVGFSSRKLRDDDPLPGKYVNSSDSEIFHKNKVLYNHPVARKATAKDKTLYITEGQFDVAAFVESGLLNVVASSGTAFTSGHVQECLKMVGSDGRLVFCFDGDAAGLTAASKVFLNYPELHTRASVVVFPESLDPCDMFGKHGAEGLVDFVEKNQIELPRFALKKIPDQSDMFSPSGSSRYVNAAARVVASVADPVLADVLMGEISLKSNTRLALVKEIVAAAEPLTSDSLSQEVVMEDPRQHQVEEPSTEALEESGESFQKVDIVALREKVAVSRLWRITVRLLALGVSIPDARGLLLKNHKAFPVLFGPFFEDLGKIPTGGKLLPEYFRDWELVEFLSEQLSPFYPVMSRQEVGQQYKFLFVEYKRELDKSKHEAKVRKVLSMLNDSGTDNVDYFEKLVSTGDISDDR